MIFKIFIAAVSFSMFMASAHAELTDGVVMRGFTDVSLIHEEADNSDSFQLHEVDFFVAKQLDDKVSFLIELCFQPDATGIGQDLERTYVQYLVNKNWLKVAAGRFHTSLGYWNDTYHHGAYLQTSATRPVMERFEDAGGLLPTHTTGVEFRGNGPLGGGTMGYIVSVGNGRGPVKDPPAFYYNYNRTKSVAALAYYETANNLRFGANYYHSDLPGGGQLNGDGTVSATITGPAGGETIAGAHLVFNSATLEWITEYEHVIHTYKNAAHLKLTDMDGNVSDLGLAPNTNLDLVFSQIGYHVGNYTPYVRFELNQADNTDAYYNAMTANGQNPGLLGTTRYYTLGTRYELSPASALKLEFVAVDSRAPIREQLKIAGADRTDHSEWSTNLNWSYGW